MFGRYLALLSFLLFGGYALPGTHPGSACVDVGLNAGAAGAHGPIAALHAAGAWAFEAEVEAEDDDERRQTFTVARLASRLSPPAHEVAVALAPHVAWSVQDDFVGLPRGPPARI